MSWDSFGTGAANQRSSTRRINPPGGRSNFSIGGQFGGAHEDESEIAPESFMRDQQRRGGRMRQRSSSQSREHVKSSVSYGRDARQRGRSTGGGKSRVHFGGDTHAPEIGGGGYRGPVTLTAETSSLSGGPPVGDYIPQKEKKMTYDDYYNAKRSSTRRIAPPGGNSSFSLGGYPEGKQDHQHRTSRSRRRSQDRSYQQENHKENRREYEDRDYSDTTKGNAQRSASFSYGAPEDQRSSTRRIAPPGGQSNLSLGWNSNSNDSHPEIQRRNGNLRSRSAVRRHYSRDRDGGGDDRAGQVQRRPPRHPRKHAHPISSTDKAALEGNALNGERTCNRAASMPWDRPMAKSSNQYASNSRQNSGNFITNRPSTKVHAPPGGGSSLSLGWS
eukprot:jgi/Bigna1/67726/fgenesh1_pg.4_\